MPAPVIMEMYQYYLEEPFGPVRDNLHTGMVCAVLSNIHRNKKRKRDPFVPLDFMIKPAEDARQNKLARGVAWLISLAKPKVNNG